MTHETDVKRQWDGLESTRVGRVAHKALTTAEVDWDSWDRANLTAGVALVVLLGVAFYRMVTA